MEYSEQCLTVAITPYERNGATGAKGCALVLLRRTGEGAALLQEHHRRCAADGNLYTLAQSEGMIGICRVLQGKISDGIVLLEAAIAKQERAGFQRAADLYRLQLDEIYARIVTRSEKLPRTILLRNLPVLLKAAATAPSRLRALTDRVLDNPHFDPAGHHAGHAKLLIGLLCKAKKRRALALQHLTQARRILSHASGRPDPLQADSPIGSTFTHFPSSSTGLHQHALRCRVARHNRTSPFPEDAAAQSADGPPGSRVAETSASERRLSRRSGLE
jgi:hypothetical protein